MKKILMIIALGVSMNVSADRQDELNHESCITLSEMAKLAWTMKQAGFTAMDFIGIGIESGHPLNYTGRAVVLSAFNTGFPNKEAAGVAGYDICMSTAIDSL